MHGLDASVRRNMRTRDLRLQAVPAAPYNVSPIDAVLLTIGRAAGPLRRKRAGRFGLLGAADEFDPRLRSLRQAAIGSEIIQRHAPRGEAFLKPLSDGHPI